MNKVLRFFLAFISSILFSIGGFAIYLYVNTDLIKNYFVTKLNEQIEAKISIHDIDLSLFSQFPKVSLDLNDVNITDPLNEMRMLLQAQHIYIGFSLYDILSRNYIIKQITIDSGTCNIYCNREGKYNFYIFKKDTTTQDNIFLKLNNIQFNKTNFNYSDLESNQFYNLFLHTIILNGSFTKNFDDFNCSGNLYVNKIKTGSFQLLKEKNAILDFALGINTDNKFISIKRGNLKIEDFLLSIEGSINNKPMHSFVDILFNAKQVSIQNLLSLLPLKFDELKSFDSNGDIYFTGSAKGYIGDNLQPRINIDLGIHNGKLKNSSSNLLLENINLKGHLDNGIKMNSESSKLDIKEFSIQIKNETVLGNLSINNFLHPFIDGQLSGRIDGAQLINLVNNKKIKTAEGDVNFNLKIKGLVNDFSNKNNWSKTQTSGNIDINLRHIKVADERKEIELIKASLSLNQNDILINSFQTKVQQSDIDIKGKMLNVIPYFLNENQQIEANIDYTSSYIDINHFIMPFTNNKRDTSKEKNNPLQLPENISLKAKVIVSKLVFADFNASNLNATVNWKGKKISIENLSCQTMNGNILTSGQIENTSDGKFLMTSSSTLKNININELFRQCNNFAQEELTNKHLFGIINATFDVASVWSANLDCDLSKLYAFGDMEISNGEVINYKPLEKLSKYSDVEDLRHIKFAELKNKIEIKNKMIFIPNMDIKSNALNLTLSGTHTFDNIVDYKFKVKLSEILKKKRKPQKNDFGEEEDESGKGLYLFLTMKGTIDNPKFNYDKLSVKNKMKQDIKIKKENIKDILQKELGIGKDTTIIEKKNDNNELEFEKD